MTEWINDLTDQSPLRNKIGWRGELEFGGATEDDRAGRTVKFRIVRRPEEQGSAHPFSAFTRRKGKASGTIFHATIASVTTGLAVYSDEVMLVNWTDNPAGATVVFQLQAESEQHPFLGYSRPSRQVAGSRFMAVMLEQETADEILATEEREARIERNSKQTVSNVAAMICKHPRFHDWLRETVEAVDWGEAKAASWLKDQVRVKSRSELDNPKNTAEIARFERIRKGFVAWQEEQGDEMNPLR